MIDIQIQHDSQVMISSAYGVYLMKNLVKHFSTGWVHLKNGSTNSNTISQPTTVHNQPITNQQLTNWASSPSFSPENLPNPWVSHPTLVVLQRPLPAPLQGALVVRGQGHLSLRWLMLVHGGKEPTEIARWFCQKWCCCWLFDGLCGDYIHI